MKEGNQREEHLRGYEFVNVAEVFKVKSLEEREHTEYSVNKYRDFLLFSHLILVVDTSSLLSCIHTL